MESIMQKFDNDSGVKNMSSSDNDKNNNVTNIAVAVMVGGQSKRMGRPKESVIIPGDGRTFLEKICDEIDAAGDIFVEKYISVRKGQEISHSGYKPVEDVYDGIGPMGGIASVLTRAKKDDVSAVLFLACDMIKYDSDEIGRIVSSYKGEDVLFARTKERGMQPLASIYSVYSLDAITAQIAEGDYRLRHIAERLDDIVYYDALNEELYENVNSFD